MQQDPIDTGSNLKPLLFALANTLVGMAVALGYISPQNADDFVKVMVAGMGALLAFGSAAIYLYGHFKLKRDVIKYSATTSTLPTSHNTQIPPSTPVISPMIPQ